MTSRPPGTVRIGMLGLGTVGSEVARVLAARTEDITRKTGMRLEVRRAAVRDATRLRDVPLDASAITADAEAVVNDPEIDVVCELIGGTDVAYELVSQALRNGKHVVTANKEMLARCGGPLMHAAGERNLDFLFEGSVAGGIPIVQPLKNILAGNEVDEIVGIVNGTTNYILSRMADDGAEFGDVLREAQARGYAEADPAADITGVDASCKMAILASIAFTSRCDVGEVAVEGIETVSAADIRYASELGYVIKLVGIAKRAGAERVEVRVHPALLPKSHPLASVGGVYNAILVHARPVGDVMFYGQGAGAGPTASSVVGDLMEVARNMRMASTGRVACTCFEHRAVAPIGEAVSRHYLRVRITDAPRILASVAGALGDQEISIESVVAHALPGGDAETVWITHDAPGAAMERAISRIRTLPDILGVENWFRIERQAGGAP